MSLCPSSLPRSLTRLGGVSQTPGPGLRMSQKALAVGVGVSGTWAGAPSETHWPRPHDTPAPLQGSGLPAQAASTKPQCHLLACPQVSLRVWDLGRHPGNLHRAETQRLHGAARVTWWEGTRGSVCQGHIRAPGSTNEPGGLKSSKGTVSVASVEGGSLTLKRQPPSGALGTTCPGLSQLAVAASSAPCPLPWSHITPTPASLVPCRLPCVQL